MRISKDIPTNESIDTSIKKLCAYWEDRGMKFVRRSETSLEGKRGNLLGNLFSFNMKHVISQIEIKKKTQKIECKLIVNTVFQYMTESNKRFFWLELETFEKYLLFDDLNEEAWKALIEESKQQDFSFVIICAMIGFGAALILGILL